MEYGSTDVRVRSRGCAVGEACGKRGPERKRNPRVNTAPAPNSDEPANNTCTGVPTIACFSPAFRPEMYSVEWLERLQDFLCVSRVPLSNNDVLARYLLSDPFRRELYPAGQARENSSEEFKKRLLDAHGPEESAGQLIERFHALHQREGQTIEQYAKEVAEVGRRAGVTERDLVARFAGGITSKEAYLAIRLKEPATLSEARRDWRQTRTGNPKSEKTEATQLMEYLIREKRLFQLRWIGPPLTRLHPQKTPNQRPPTGTHSGGPGNRRVLSIAGLQAGDTPCVKERDLVARFGGGITSREVYRVIRLLEPPTLAEAPKLATRIIQVEDDFQERQQPRAGISKPEKTEMAQKIDTRQRHMRLIMR
ncbi:hypothetical protein T03_14580 [Trichinella britovi]|uniref:Retrotransposon gag domain-containing protein n=1 Tax=Trichinella britovi TaxID=45882 RepID=A0A0V1C6J6_TRIBR|nr:hypothetical protein T03_14580 [Trichinella britovi]